MSSRQNRVPPPPPPHASVVFPTWVLGGGATLAGGVGGGGPPIPTKGQTLWYSSVYSNPSTCLGNVRYLFVIVRKIFVRFAQVVSWQKAGTYTVFIRGKNILEDFLPIASFILIIILSCFYMYFHMTPEETL